VAAEYDNTSFGIRQRREDIAALTAIRQAMMRRTTYTTDPEKLDALHRLIAAADQVLSTLTT